MMELDLVKIRPADGTAETVEYKRLSKTIKDYLTIGL